jgi:hypothetical protein
MSLPFKALLPIDGRVLLLRYVPVYPHCFEAEQSSESESESSSESEESQPQD